MNKRAKILKLVNRQFEPGLPEWIGEVASLVFFGIAAYITIIVLFSL